MPRDILGSYGPDAAKKQVGAADCGGVLPGDVRDVMNYSPPTGPTNILDSQGPGLHGKNHGCGQVMRSASRGGQPGLGGNNYGNNPKK